MKIIYKYQLKTTDQQTITMPVGSTIISLQIQNGIPCIWAEVDTLQNVGDRTFVTFGTGHPLPENPLVYVGTYQLEEGNLIFHVYEMYF
ncbi:hypothetical protein [Chryseobacterium bernardetii]|uniref:DUF7352 domain-containing protein n=1 Tax=Chryseobacterium bernardetii TaxID=1241978 RepID=UPI001627CA58|nr:hypothetical protein [Chryseobacterium bernardetii]